MKITLFTSNSFRHNYLINLLSSISDELFVIQEVSTIFPGKVPGRYPATQKMTEYFNQVTEAQRKIFGFTYINPEKNNIKVLTISPSDLNICPLNKIKDFLKSDLYIVFGSSYIKGDLIEFLISKRAINIHMGISPYYRGTDCNFWAMYDKNYHVVGATIHLISKGIDNGKILYHALSKRHENPFIYSMNTVISAFNSLKSKISDNSIFSLQQVEQDISKEIRYSKNKDFDDKAICNFLKQKKLPDFKFDNSMLINPYFHEI